jgi:hypothetical protein
MASKFKIGDKVRRIVLDNGVQGACIGTIATVTGVDGYGYIAVYYPGCFDDGDGVGCWEGYELWHTDFAELVQEPQHEDKKDEEEPMTLQDAYLAMQKASGIKAGDTVRVLRKAADFELGWGQVWDSPKMDDYIGQECEVTSIDGRSGVIINGWCFPFFVLEKIASAPRFITINGFEVPEPVREPLETGEKYWVVSITPFQDPTSTFCREYPWTYDDFDYIWLERGLIHRTQEAAEKHAKALLSFTEMEEARNVR